MQTSMQWQIQKDTYHPYSLKYKINHTTCQLTLDTLESTYQCLIIPINVPYSLSLNEHSLFKSLHQRACNLNTKFLKEECHELYYLTLIEEYYLPNNAILPDSYTSG